MIIDPEYGVIVFADVGEVVWDDLTRTNATIVSKKFDEYGNLGYWLDNDYVGGGRFPWEVSPPRGGSQNG
jgi:hypothetical protein